MLSQDLAQLITFFFFWCLTTMPLVYSGSVLLENVYLHHT